MFYIIAEDGEVFCTTDRSEAIAASNDGISIVIDAARNVAIVDGEATQIPEWEPPEDESDDDESEDDDE